MNDQERQLLEETKQSVSSPSVDVKATDEKQTKDIDVEALLRMNGLSRDVQPTKSNKKWVLLAVFAVIVIISMIAISYLLNELSK